MKHAYLNEDYYHEDDADLDINSIIKERINSLEPFTSTNLRPLIKRKSFPKESHSGKQLPLTSKGKFKRVKENTALII